MGPRHHLALAPCIAAVLRGLQGSEPSGEGGARCMSTWLCWSCQQLLITPRAAGMRISDADAEVNL